MDALILAAGLGTRLRPLTEYLPKPLVPVLNTPLIDLAIDWLRVQGMSRFTVNSHYKADLLRSHLNQRALHDRIDITESHEPAILGTGGAILKVIDAFKGDCFVLWNSDILFAPELGPVIEGHRSSGALATLVLRRRDVQKFGGFTREPDGLITSYVPPSPGRPPLHAGIYTGVMVLSPEIRIHFPPGKDIFCIIADVIRPLIEKGERVRGVFSDETWSDLGNPEAYFRANFEELALLESGPNPLTRFLRSLLERKGYENRGNGFWAMPHQKQVPAQGPSLVGPDVVCGRDVALGERVIIGSGARIYGAGLLEDSIVWPGVEAVLRSPSGNRKIQDRIFSGSGYYAVPTNREEIPQLPPV